MYKKFLKKIYDKLLKYKAHIIIILTFIFLIYSAYEYYSKYFYILSNPNRVKNIVVSYGKYSVLAFISLQIIQVVAFFIPGEIIQIAGGYIYGTVLGTIFSFIGITLGSAIVYGISHFYGKPLINKLVSRRDLKFFQRLLNIGSINYIVFLLYLIPGIPKDVLAYICGISEITFKNFILYSTLGRIPGIIISAYFGAKIGSGHNIILITIAVIMTVLFLLGIYKGEKIIKYMVKNSEPKNDK